MFLLLEYPMFRLRVRFHRSNIQNFKFLMSTNSLCGVSCTHYRLLKITRAYLFPASCGLRTLSSLGRLWGTTYRKAWISAAQARFPTDSAPNRRFVVFVLLTPRFKSVDDAWAGDFWAEWSRISGVKRGRNGETRSVSSGPKAQGQ
jgi:hypothetical protein